MPGGQSRFTVGVDYGSNSVRAVVVDVATGREISACVFDYPSGTNGIILDARDPALARQNPVDYCVGFDAAVAGAIEKAALSCKSFNSEQITGIGIDATGSTPVPVDCAGRALCEGQRFGENMAAMAWLWKDHTSWAEAEEITRLAVRRGEPYLARCGGSYSSEWFWSKILHCLKCSPDVFAAAYSWVEQADFICGYVTGNRDPLTMSRSICAAGHKAMYADIWGGLPSKEFLGELAPELADLRDRLYDKASPVDHCAGYLAADIAARVGLPAGIPVATGAIDAHLGAVGAGIKPGVLVKILGTSACDLMLVPDSLELAELPGVCGIVNGSVVPGKVALEAGQSAVGDIFNWFVDHLCPAEMADGNAHANLTQAASLLKPGASGLLALDWNNGNRSVLTDPLLSGLLLGQTLHSSAAEIYRALIEATAFGALKIIERFEQYGVLVNEVLVCGGIADKNPLVMQIYADVCQRPMKVSSSLQSCALGAAICGAVVGGAYKDVPEAQEAMSAPVKKVYMPDAGVSSVYASLFELYKQLHDSFGGQGSVDMGSLMKRLMEIRRSVLS